jgi:hypothetical protein
LGVEKFVMEGQPGSHIFCLLRSESTEQGDGVDVPRDA